jgi:hypothetical protein
MVKADTCAVWRGGVWEKIDIAEALPIRSEYRMRCCECRGRVRAHREASNGMRAHFEHCVAHSGCSLSTKFSGTHSPHPDAVPDKLDHVTQRRRYAHAANLMSRSGSGNKTGLKRKTALAIECDVRRGIRWEKISIAEALAVKGQFIMRCSECHGLVKPHKEAKNKSAAHFEHDSAHSGCSRSTIFNGTHSPHPASVS